MKLYLWSNRVQNGQKKTGNKFMQKYFQTNVEGGLHTIKIQNNLGGGLVGFVYSETLD